MIARTGEVQRLAKYRNVQAIDRAVCRSERALQPVAADIGIRLDLRDPLVLQVDEGQHGFVRGGGFTRHREIDKFLRLVLAEAGLGEQLGCGLRKSASTVTPSGSLNSP